MSCTHNPKVIYTAFDVNVVVIIDVSLVSKSRDAIGGTGKSSIIRD